MPLENNLPSIRPTRAGLCSYYSQFVNSARQVQPALCLVRKQLSQPLMATDITGPRNSGRLIFVTDRTSGLRCLVDSGAEISVIPPLSRKPTFSHAGVALQAVNTLPLTPLVNPPSHSAWDT